MDDCHSELEVKAIRDKEKQSLIGCFANNNHVLYVSLAGVCVCVCVCVCVGSASVQALIKQQDKGAGGVTGHVVVSGCGAAVTV